MYNIWQTHTHIFIIIIFTEIFFLSFLPFLFTFIFSYGVSNLLIF